MADLPNRDDLEDEFAREIARILREHQAEWSTGRTAPQTQEELRRRYEVLLLLLFTSGVAIAAGELHIAVDGAGQGRAWAGRMASALAQLTVRRLLVRVRSVRNRPPMVTDPEQPLTPFSVDYDELNRRLAELANEDRYTNTAATEVTRAFTAGGEFAADTYKNQMGEPALAFWYTSTKRGSNQPDERVCTICRPLHQTPRDRWEQDFPAGPPAHPQCILPGQLVDAPAMVSGASKAFYDGPCIQISTAHGRKLAITENHPVLTTRGWIAAKFIRKGDHCIDCATLQPVASRIGPNYQHTPAVIEQVSGSLRKRPQVIANTMPVAAEDFHGDGRFMHGNVDVVAANRLLLSSDQSRFAKLIRQPTLLGADVGLAKLSANRSSDQFVIGPHATSSGTVSRCKHGLLLGRCGPGPAHFHRVGSSSHRHSGTFKAKPQGAAKYSQFGSEGLFAFAGNVSLNHGLEPGNAYRGPASAKHHSGLQHDFFEASAGNPHLARQLVSRFPRVVSLDEVIDVSNFRFRGHVYDLEVESVNWYACNGLIVHNCRCWIDYKEPE